MKQDITVYGTPKRRRKSNGKSFRVQCEVCKEWFETGYEKQVVHSAKDNYDCWRTHSYQLRKARYKKLKESA